MALLTATVSDASNVVDLAIPRRTSLWDPAPVSAEVAVDGGSVVGVLATKNAIAMVRGSSLILTLTLKDSADDATDLTGATVRFSLKADLAAERPTLTKVSDFPDQISIASPRSGTARILLRPEDTKRLALGTYLFDVWVRLENGAVYVPVPMTTLELKAGVTSL